MHYLITGANRGIGLELVRQLIERGDTVDATARDLSQAKALDTIANLAGARLRRLTCDVSSDTSVDAMVKALGNTPIDVVINNAGVYGHHDSIERFDAHEALEVFNVNALGPIRVTQRVLGLVRKGTKKCLAHITSGMGSISDNSSGGAYAYRMSKAALNMASKSMSVDLAAEKITSVVINPGWVKTDMGGPGAPLPVETSAKHIIALLDRLTLADTGKFFDHSGRTWDW